MLLTFLIKKFPQINLEDSLLQKYFYILILTISPILNLVSLSLIYLLESIDVLDFPSTGFILIVL